MSVKAENVGSVKVKLVDPSGDVTPYDHALAAALARRGAAVELITSRFLYGPLAAERDYELTELFYPLATRLGLEARRRRRAAKALEHPAGMLRLRRRLADGDVAHYQWLRPADRYLLPPKRPRVMTVHNVLRRSGAVEVAREMDAVVVHTRHGERELVERVGVDPGRVRVIPHGAFTHMLDLPGAGPLPPELAAVEGPVILCFGTIRPYKGIDVLLRAFAGLDGAELWIVGRPLNTPLEPLRRLAGDGVRFVTRYLPEPEVPAYFRRADVVVLPHREVDQSGVLNVALAFGKPIVMSAVGGFEEVAEDTGAGLLVPPEDPDALADALRGLLDDPAARERLGEAARAAAEGPLFLGRGGAPYARPLLRADRMKALLLAKHKRSAVRALETLVDSGCDVRGVVVAPPAGDEHPSQRTDQAAVRLGIDLIGEEDAYALAGEVDLVISFLYPRLIREPLISGPEIGCLNFHPAPLPDMRGLGGYNVAVLEGFTEWGVSAHFVDERFDTGDLVEVRRFAIDPAAETAWSLDLRSQEVLLEVFGEVVETLMAGDDLPREPQGEGRYVSREDLEEMRRTPPDAGPEEIERRIRAFWYPPWPGATIERDGGVYTLVDEARLADVARALRDGGEVP